jgi:GT2 family glycosyltransferase
MKISIVIPWFNTDWLVDKNIPVFIKALENKKNNVSEIIIVDDASSDKSAALIKHNFPEVRLIRHKSNKGFSAAVNTGVRLAKGDLICLINSDVVPSINFLENIYDNFKDDRVFAVSLNEIGVFGWSKGFFKDGFVGHEPGGKSETVHDTFWVSGGSGVFRRDYWMDLGGLDEKLLSPFYWEDVDLSYRALKRGYRLVWDPKAIVEHKHETTINKLPKKYVQRVQERNQLLFIWKNLTSTRLFGKHLAGLLKRLASHPGYLRIVMMALSRLGIVLKARNKEIRESKVSDEVIFSRF